MIDKKHDKPDDPIRHYVGALAVILFIGAALAVIPAQASSNLLSDPGFENGGTGWTGTNLGGRSITAAQAHSGSYSQQMAVSASYGREVYQNVAVSGGTAYDAAGWIKLAGVNGAGSRIEVVWLGSTGTAISTNAVGSLVGTQNWTRVSATFTAPSNAVTAKFRLFTAVDPDGSGTAWFDDTSLSVSTPQQNGSANWLDASIVAPATDLSVVQNGTFVLSAKVYCNGTGTDCGTVEGLARYGSSGAEPVNGISTAAGSTPFYILSAYGTGLARPASWASVGVTSPENASDDGFNDTTTLADFNGQESEYATYVWNLAPGAQNPVLYYTYSCKTVPAINSDLLVFNYSVNGFQLAKYLSTNGSITTNSMVLAADFVSSAGEVMVRPYRDELGPDCRLQLYDIYISVTDAGAANNPESCGPLPRGQTCGLSWTVSATGGADTAWNIDVNFNSTSPGVVGNNTPNKKIGICASSGCVPTPPSVAITSPSGGQTVSGVITVSASASDDTAVAGVQFQVGGTNIGAEDTAAPYSAIWDTKDVANGYYVLTAQARDTSGNTAVSAGVTVLVNNTPLAPELLSNPGFENNGSGWNNTRLSGRSITTAQLHSGGRSLQINVSSSAVRGVFQDVDVSPNSDYIASGWVKTKRTNGNGTSIQIQWLGSNGAAVRTDVLGRIIGSSDWKQLSGRYTSPSSAAKARFRLLAEKDPDGSGMAWFDDNQFLLRSAVSDSAPPSVTVTFPVSGSVVSNTATVFADAFDDTGVAGVQFMLDGANIGAEDTTVPYSASIDTTPLAEGGHTLSAAARDFYSNAGSSSAVTILVNQSRRNIIFIISDDQRWDTMQYMPLMNSRLGGESIKFSNAFVSTSLCCPSRSSALDGLYNHNNGIKFTSAPNGGAIEFDDSSTIATWLKYAGYRTSLIGKYLNGYSKISLQVPPGWDDWHVFLNEAYYNYTLNENRVLTSYGSAPSDYSTDVLSARAASFISTTPPNQPLFLYFAPFAPHYPYTPAQPDVDSLAGVAPWRPPSYNEADVSDKPLWVRQLPLINASRSANGDVVRQRQLESLQAVDRAVSSIIDVLNQTGRLDSTIIIYTSDNGFMWGEHRILEDKMCVYDECGRVPLWVWMPGQLGSTDDHLVENVDFAPTIAEGAGVGVPNNVNGVSFAKLLENPATPWRTEVLLEGWGHFASQTSKRGFSAVRTQQYVYAEYNNGNREFYDIAADTYQLTNKVGNPAYATIVAQLKSTLAALKIA